VRPPQRRAIDFILPLRMAMPETATNLLPPGAPAHPERARSGWAPGPSRGPRHLGEARGRVEAVGLLRQSRRVHRPSLPHPVRPVGCPDRHEAVRDGRERPLSAQRAFPVGRGRPAGV
jgi:hypothetical protein